MPALDDHRDGEEHEAPPRLLVANNSGEVFFYFIGTPHEDTNHYKTIQGNPSKKDAQPLAARLLFDYRLCTTVLGTIHKDWLPFAVRTSVVA